MNTKANFSNLRHCRLVKKKKIESRFFTMKQVNCFSELNEGLRHLFLKLRWVKKDGVSGDWRKSSLG